MIMETMNYDKYIEIQDRLRELGAELTMIENSIREFRRLLPKNSKTNKLPRWRKTPQGKLLSKKRREVIRLMDELKKARSLPKK